MPELREVFEMVTKQTEPDTDSWKEQEDRQRRTARNRKIGAIAAVAAIVSALVLVFALTRPSEETTQPAHTGPGGGQPSLTPGLSRQDRIIVGLDGETQGTVAGLPEDAFALNLSSDGTTIAFVTAVEGRNEIATIGIDGQGMRIVGPGAQPAISPDGQQIAFVRRGDIHVMSADGSDVRRLTTALIGTSSHSGPPTGRRSCTTTSGMTRPRAQGIRTPRSSCRFRRRADRRHSSRSPGNSSPSPRTRPTAQRSSSGITRRSG